MGLPVVAKRFPKSLSSSVLPLSLSELIGILLYVSAIQSYCTGSLFMAKIPAKPKLICHLREMPP